LRQAEDFDFPAAGRERDKIKFRSSQVKSMESAS